MEPWQPIVSAPADAELALSIYDGGEYHVLVFPCRREDFGWRDVRANRLLRNFKPTHWRRWEDERKQL